MSNTRLLLLFNSTFLFYRIYVSIQYSTINFIYCYVLPCTSDASHLSGPPPCPIHANSTWYICCLVKFYILVKSNQNPCCSVIERFSSKIWVQYLYSFNMWYEFNFELNKIVHPLPMKNRYSTSIAKGRSMFFFLNIFYAIP